MGKPAIDRTFTLAATAGAPFPLYHVELLGPGTYTLTAERNSGDAWNAYVRKPTDPAHRYASLMRVFDVTSYGGMGRVVADDAADAAPPVNTLEYGVINVATIDEAFGKFGRNTFQLFAGPVRPVMFAIYIGLGTQHSGGITLRLRSGHPID